jgi:hypothetical protein
VLICSCCDRGQIYCAEGCAKRVRRRAVKGAAQRYQNSPPGRTRRAARQARYWARDKKVTHHGSPPPRPGDRQYYTSHTRPLGVDSGGESAAGRPLSMETHRLRSLLEMLQVYAEGYLVIGGAIAMWSAFLHIEMPFLNPA